MTINPYLVLNGNAFAALELYSKAFGVTPMVKTFGDMPGFDGPEEAKKMVLHGNIQVGSTILMISDSRPTDPVTMGDNITLSVSADSVDELKNLFDILSVDGTVDLAPEETFFADCYTNFTDQFGITWQIMTGERQV